MGAESEVARIGAQALADTPGTKFHRKAQLRFAAREAFARSSNDAALRRAELRKVRPSRGPFPIGTYVFYFDAAAKEPGPNCWRGVARVVGKEGSRTIWISHRGILLAVSPEHLALADDSEVQQWLTVSDEVELMDVIPPSGGTGFIDLRRQEPAAEAHEPGPVNGDGRREEEARQPPRPEQPGDLSSSSLSAARMRWESERGADRARRSSEFFRDQDRRRKQRRGSSSTAPLPAPSPPAQTPQPQDAPAGRDDDLDLFSEIDWDPDVNDYHAQPARRQLSPMVESPEEESQEREAKRLKATGAAAGEHGNYVEESFDAYLAAASPGYLRKRALDHYYKHESSYLNHDISAQDFMFGVRRNTFQERYEALAATEKAGADSGAKKKGRKELKLSEVTDEQRQLFVGKGGSDEKEWSAWKMKEACEILSAAESTFEGRSQTSLCPRVG